MQTTTCKQWRWPFTVQGDKVISLGLTPLPTWCSAEPECDQLLISLHVKCRCVLPFFLLPDVLLFYLSLCISNCRVKVAKKREKQVAPPLSLVDLTLSTLTPYALRLTPTAVLVLLFSH